MAVPADAIGRLLDALALQGQTLTMHAAFIHWTVAEHIVQGGASVLAGRRHLRATAGAGQLRRG